MKKAQAEVFNWIFVIVIGAVVFLFFVGFAYKYKDLSEQRNDVRLLRSVDVMLEGLKSDNLYNEATGVKFKFNIEDGDLVIGDFYRSFNDKIIFGSEIDGNELKAWIKEFKMPYKITNFIFLSDDKTKYFFIGNEGETIKDLLPNENGIDRFDIEAISFVNEAIFENNEKARFIFFTNANGDELREALSKGEVVEIVNNKITYFDQNGDIIETFESFNDLLKIGAVFSNYRNFRYNYDAIKKQIKNMATLYKERTLLMKCNGAFISPTYLDDLYSLNFNTLNDLERQNQALRNQNCKTIY